MLDEHAGYLLLADEENAVWPAAPFLEHLNTTASDTARPWLAARRTGCCRGPGALDALLRLARAGALTPAGGRSLLPHITAPARPEAPSGRGGFARRLAARWARTLPVAARDQDWVLVAETLLTDAVDAEHTRHLALEAVLKRAHSVQEATEAGPAPEPGAEHAAAGADLEVEETIVRQNADRLPGGLHRPAPSSTLPQRMPRPVFRLPSGCGRGPDHPGPRAPARPPRRCSPAPRPGPPRRCGPGRPRPWPRPRRRGGTKTGEWWDRAVEGTVRLLADRPTPEGARLAYHVLTTCPPERAEGLRRRARAALNPRLRPPRWSSSCPPVWSESMAAQYREWRRAHFTRNTRRHILDDEGRPVLDEHGRPSDAVYGPDAVEGVTFTRRRTWVRGTWIHEHLPPRPTAAPVYALDPRLTRTSQGPG
ncbi:hypothetical protein [Streptomyces sp. DH8]|uniref:hypothetical protein n=1 Tax=Streptomyces sp. DH8 TaxID=2857008 RepID=UPI001E620368|nr:hypothetical protein [Streptomyces sp. DH8]